MLPMLLLALVLTLLGTLLPWWLLRRLLLGWMVQPLLLQQQLQQRQPVGMLLPLSLLSLLLLRLLAVRHACTRSWPLHWGRLLQLLLLLM
jgi:hypothetical protein